MVQKAKESPQSTSDKSTTYVWAKTNRRQRSSTRVTSRLTLEKTDPKKK